MAVFSKAFRNFMLWDALLRCCCVCKLLALGFPCAVISCKSVLSNIFLPWVSPEFFTVSFSFQFSFLLACLVWLPPALFPSCFLSILIFFILFRDIYTAWQILPQSQICIFQLVFACLWIPNSHHFLISYNESGQCLICNERLLVCLRALQKNTWVSPKSHKRHEIYTTQVFYLLGSETFISLLNGKYTTCFLNMIWWYTSKGRFLPYSGDIFPKPRSLHIDVKSKFLSEYEFPG